MRVKTLIWGGVGLVGMSAIGISAIVGLCLFCATEVPIASLTAETASANASVSTAEVGTSVGQRLPEVRFNALDGRTIQLNELPSQPTVLYFSAVWCTSCRAEVKELAHVKERYKNDITIVYVDTTPQTDTPADVQKFSEEFGHPDFLWTLDNEQDPAVIPLNVFGLGTAYLVDAQRVVAFRGMNSISTDLFQDTLQSLLE